MFYPLELILFENMSKQLCSFLDVHCTRGDGKISDFISGTSGLEADA